MKLELLFLGGLVFFVMDTWKDGVYTKQLYHYKKHAKTIGVVFGMFSLYWFLKQNPLESRNMMSHLQGMIRYMPMDKTAKDILLRVNTPMYLPPQQRRIMTSGQSQATGRSVSGTKKKYVAATQGWKCGTCKTQLDAWYEVDHKVRLADGGSNHISNLVALCRNCHGKKTTIENF
jgi:5-methylcytosine-specific restriction endonuclease McrA